MTGPDDDFGRSLPPDLDPRSAPRRRGASPPPRRRPEPASASRSTSPRAGGGGSLPPDLDPRGRPGHGGGGRPPGSPPRRLGRKRGWSRRRVLVVVAGGVAAVLVAVVAVVGGSAAYVASKIHHIDPFCSSCSRPSGGASGDLNILIVGSDSRAGLSKAQQKQLHVGHDAGQRSDTMILLHLPAGGGKPVLVNLPRDSYVKIPSYTSDGHTYPAQMNKLNAAYSFGGAPLTVETVEDNTDVRIDHYLEINFEGFVKMVDALGGVSICNSKPIHDPVHYDASTGGDVGSGLELPAGTTTLSGVTALEYVRAREFDPAQGDLGRIERQQKFMGAMVRKAESTGVLLDPPKLFGFLDAVASSLTTDNGFGIEQMKRLALALRSTSPKDIDMLTVPLSDTNYASPVGSAVLWNKPLADKLFTDFTDDTPITNVTGTTKNKVTIPPGEVDLQVLNATDTSGLAATTADSLSHLGFGISGTGNAPSGSSPLTTQVLYGSGKAESARTVAAAVPGSVLKADSSLPADGIELLVGSAHHSVVPVTVASSSPNQAHVTTAADNTCNDDD